MMNYLNGYGGYSGYDGYGGFEGFGMHNWGLLHGVASIFIISLLWIFFWKGLALWHSAKRGDKWRFVALLLINTLGILEIGYLLLVAKIKFSELLGSDKTQ